MEDSELIYYSVTTSVSEAERGGGYHCSPPCSRRRGPYNRRESAQIILCVFYLILLIAVLILIVFFVCRYTPPRYEITTRPYIILRRIGRTEIGEYFVYLEFPLFISMQSPFDFKIRRMELEFYPNNETEVRSGLQTHVFDVDKQAYQNQHRFIPIMRVFVTETHNERVIDCPRPFYHLSSHLTIRTIIEFKDLVFRPRRQQEHIHDVELRCSPENIPMPASNNTFLDFRGNAPKTGDSHQKIFRRRGGAKIVGDLGEPLESKTIFTDGEDPTKEYVVSVLPEHKMAIYVDGPQRMM